MKGGESSCGGDEAVDGLHCDGGECYCEVEATEREKGKGVRIGTPFGMERKVV